MIKKQGSSDREKRKRKAENRRLRRTEEAKEYAAKQPAPNYRARAMALPAALLEAQFRNLVSSPRITTPAAIDPNVQTFCDDLSGGLAPRFLECEPLKWSRLGMCNVNVREYVKVHGGQMLCGYRIWCNANYAEAERHAIWADGDTWKDVSFCEDLESSILFVPDVPSKQADFDASPKRIRRGFTQEAGAITDAFEAKLESRIIYQEMSDDEGWENMPSYETYLRARGMPTGHLVE